MLRSMTAFARQEGTGGWGTVTWELRSVNSRYLDVSTRLPEDFRALEPVVRERVSAMVSRGKLDCTLRFQPGAEQIAHFSVNTERLRRKPMCTDNPPANAHRARLGAPSHTNVGRANHMPQRSERVATP